MSELQPSDRDARAHDASAPPAESAAPEQGLLRGVGVVPGIAIGPAYVYTRETMAVEQRRIGAGDVKAETERFERAVQRSERELEKIISITQEKLGEESAGIFEAQRLMLRDEALYEAVMARIRGERDNADFAVKDVMGHHRRRMKASGNAYMRERASDLEDVQDRLIRHLRRGKLLSAVEPSTIVVAESLTAADLMLFSRHGILGCVMDRGGATSHVSIMARALDLPTVVSTRGISDAVQGAEMLILDGTEGRIITSPSGETLAEYRVRQKRYARLREEQKHLAALPSETADGRAVTLRANVEFEQEIDLLHENGADGIGLFRTEIMLLMRGRQTLSEEHNYATYRAVVEAVGPAMTTFRLLDLGGDKMLPLAHREHNPFLGWRGIRVLLDKPNILRAQLRAVLRASAHGPLRILLPMITEVSEVERFQAVLAEVQEDLAADGHAFADDIPVGIMVEVPAVALMAERFARVADFFSIGTNDLTQYVLAVDRGNERVAATYSELHPAVLALIHRAVCAGHEAGIPVGLCGEMAADPRAAPLLIGLGVDELSASPTQLPGIKGVVRAVRYDEAQQLAERALQASGADAVAHMVEAWMHEHAAGATHFLADAPLEGSRLDGEQAEAEREA